MKVRELVDYIDCDDGDIIAIKTDDNSIHGVTGSTEDFNEKGFLRKGKYILFKAIDSKEIYEDDEEDIEEEKRLKDRDDEIRWNK